MPPPLQRKNLLIHPTEPTDEDGFTQGGVHAPSFQAGLHAARTSALPAGTPGTGAGGTARELTQDYLTSRQPVTDAEANVLDQKARKAAGISAADWPRYKQNGDPWTNGTFKPAADREGELNANYLNSQAAGREAVQATAARQQVNGLPRVAQTVGPTPPVGGEQAVVPKDAGYIYAAAQAPNAGGGATGDVGKGELHVSTRKDASVAQTELTSPYGGGVTTYDKSLFNRQPVIAGADGKNVAGDLVDRKDPTLDPGYLAGLPRARNQSAVTPAVNRFAIPDRRDWANAA